MTNNHFRLIDTMGTHNPALITLKEKGYELGIDPPTNEDGEVDMSPESGVGFFWAKKQEHEFVAGDPLTLLGLVSIWEHRGDIWRRDDDIDVDYQLMTEVYGDE